MSDCLDIANTRSAFEPNCIGTTCKNQFAATRGKRIAAFGTWQ